MSLPSPLRHVLAGGLVAGTLDLIYICTVVMNHVVVPLSAIGAAIPTPAWMVASHLAAHMFLVGTTCALFARRALFPTPEAPPATTS